MRISEDFRKRTKATGEKLTSENPETLKIENLNNLNENFTGTAKTHEGVCFGDCEAFQRSTFARQGGTDAWLTAFALWNLGCRSYA
jgi:hypothetical protein